MKFSQKNSFQFSYKHIDTASARWINWYIWRSYFEYFARWVVSRDCIVVYFWKVDPGTKDRSLSDSAPPPCLPPAALCHTQSRTHATPQQLRFADTLKVILSFPSCQGSAHFMHFFWGLDPHIPLGRRSWHPNKRKQGLLGSQRSGLWPSHILSCCLHSPGHFY